MVLVSVIAFQTARRHQQDYLDLGFHPAVLHMHPSNSSEPSAAASYGCKVLGSYVGTDEFILHSLEIHLTHLNDLADKFILRLPSAPFDLAPSLLPYQALSSIPHNSSPPHTFLRSTGQLNRS